MSKSLMTIPLCQLQRSKTNVRKTDATADIEQLAASIEAHGLLENLVVTLAETKGRKALYDVIAGGRRHAALKLLAKRRKIASDHPVPCQLRKANGASPTELSLAENVERAPLHPADQFEAFARLQADGLSAEEIACRFGLTATLVVQRLKLASVSPRLIQEYRENRMILEQLMAFAIGDGHAAQEELWFDLSYADRSPAGIRRYLTKAHVEGRDRRARFIGADAYEAAGGVIVRDLFDQKDEGYFADGALLDRLVAEKLEKEIEPIRAEGWKWVKIAADIDFERMARLARAPKVEIVLNKKEEKRLRKLAARYDELVAELEDNGEESSEELDRVAEELSALQAKKEVWPEEAKATAGAVIGLSHDGSLSVVRGLIRPEDQAAGGEDDDEPRERECKAKISGPYSETLLLELSAHRTAVLREVLANRPEDALTALLHALTASIFLAPADGCVVIKPVVTDIEHAAKSASGSKAQLAFRERHVRWAERLGEASDIWVWLQSLSHTERLALLAHCVAASVNGLRSRNGSGGAEAAASRLAQRLDLDMAAWWRPTRANFFKSVSKTQIVCAVTEALSPFEAKRLQGLKKEDMAERAEHLLAETCWLPEPLRSAATQCDQNI